MCLIDRIRRGRDQGCCHSDLGEEGSSQKALSSQEHPQEPTYPSPKDSARQSQTVHHWNATDRIGPQALGEASRGSRCQGKGGLRGFPGREWWRRSGWYGCRWRGWSFHQWKDGTKQGYCRASCSSNGPKVFGYDYVYGMSRMRFPRDLKPHETDLLRSLSSKTPRLLSSRDSE